MWKYKQTLFAFSLFDTPGTCGDQAWRRQREFFTQDFSDPRISIYSDKEKVCQIENVLCIEETLKQRTPLKLPSNTYDLSLMTYNMYTLYETVHSMM